MEQTFMKFAKSVGGFSSTFCMFGAYERWCRATSTRAQYHKKLLEMCGFINDPDFPKKGKDWELKKAKIEKSEKAVIKVITTIRNFTNPLEVAGKSKLYVQPSIPCPF